MAAESDAPPSPSSPPPVSGWRKLLLGCGCGCAFPLFFLAVLVVLAVWFGETPLRQFATRPSLPQIPPITQQDRWNLLEKRSRFSGSQEVPANGTDPAEARVASPPAPAGSRLELTPGEFNALLSLFSPPPTLGFALQRLSALPSPDRLCLFFQGSGFWLRSCTIQVELSWPTGQPTAAPVITGLRANSLDLSTGRLGAWARTWFEAYLRRTAHDQIDAVRSTGYNMSIGSESIAIDATFPGLIPPRKGERP